MTGLVDTEVFSVLRTIPNAGAIAFSDPRGRPDESVRVFNSTRDGRS